MPGLWKPRYGPEIDLWALGVTTYSLRWTQKPQSPSAGDLKPCLRPLNISPDSAHLQRLGSPGEPLRISGSLPFVGEGGSEDLRGISGVVSSCIPPSPFHH